MTGFELALIILAVVLVYELGRADAALEDMRRRGEPHHLADILRFPQDGPASREELEQD